VKVQVHVQPAACALQLRDHARLPTLNVTLPGRAVSAQLLRHLVTVLAAADRGTMSGP